MTDQINSVLEILIPNIKIGITSLGLSKTVDGDIGEKLDFISLHHSKSYPLKYESEGTKHVISLLSRLIAVYNKPNICLVIDDFDTCLFEYLFGQLLQLLDSSAKGQFIFTSHNLRALEVLTKEKIIFSTLNPKNRYISLKNVDKNQNLRDFYLRSMSIENQDEEIYVNTSLFDIKRAFRKAIAVDD